jgi:peptide/nickel transport system substrate-binding protein
MFPKAFLAALIVLIMLLQTTMPVALSQKEGMYANIFDYIHREPWMKPGGTVKVPMMGEAGTLNPFTFTTSWEAMIIDLVYDTLVILTPDLKFAGRLAKEWSVSEDGMVWTFKLFENATWHDGKPVTAEDVEFTYNLLRDIGNKTRWASLAVLIDRAEAVDRYTVKIYLKKPYAPFLLRIASQVYIVPKHLWQEINETEIIKFKNENPVGSGPFIYVEHKPQQYYKLKANPNYHLGRPLVDEVVFPIISNPEAMLLAFQKGEVDVMTWSIPYASIPKVKNLPGVKLHPVLEYGARFVYFNCQRWPMNETKFRQAVHHLINLTYVVKVIYQGYALPGSLGRLPPTLKPWANPNVPPKEEKYPFSLEAAAKLLDEIGFRDVDGDGIREDPSGKDITIYIYSPAYDPLRVRWGEIIANNLKKVGVQVKYQPLEWTTLVNKLTSGDYDMLVIGGLGDLDPDILYDIFHSKGGWNMGKCSFPELDKLLEEQRFTVDIEKRKEIVWKIQEMLSELVPLLNAVHQQFVFAYRVDRFEGWVVGPFMSPDNFFSYMNIYSVEINKPPKTVAKTTTTTMPTTTTASPSTTAPKATATTTTTVTAVTTSTVTVTSTVPTALTTTTQAGIPAPLKGVIALAVVVIIIAAAALIARRR